MDGFIFRIEIAAVYIITAFTLLNSYVTKNQDLISTMKRQPVLFQNDRLPFHRQKSFLDNYLSKFLSLKYLSALTCLDLFLSAQTSEQVYSDSHWSLFHMRNTDDNRKPLFFPHHLFSIILSHYNQKTPIHYPPEGMTSRDIRNMSVDELLDMDYFFNDDDLDDDYGEEGFYIF